MSAIVVTEPLPSGRVLLKTSLGDILVELWAREAPKAVRNFIQLALEGYYDGVIFHRVVRGFVAQTGDASGTGKNGECIYDEGMFDDEFNQRLQFNRRGLMAMANQGSRNTNLSQFFFTLDKTPELQGHNTIFGRVAGDTLFNVLKLNELEMEDGSERPVYPPTIKSVEVLENPFDDIVPRITPKERKEQERAKREMKLERAKQREQAKRKGTKNAALLSFGAEPEDPPEEAAKKHKFKSSHDVLDDPRLRKEVIEGGFVAMPGMDAVRDRENKTVNARDSNRDNAETKKESRKVEASTSRLELAREAKKAQVDPKAKLSEDIAKVRADLKKMADVGEESDDAADGKKPKSKKRSGPSLLQLEREKYMKSGVASKGKRAREEDTVSEVLNGFKMKLAKAVKTAPAVVEDEENLETEGGVLGIDENLDDDNSAGWLTHALRFRKDATLDQHKLDEYSTYDPLAKNVLSLSELKQKADDTRKYSGKDGRIGKGSDNRAERRDGGSGNLSNNRPEGSHSNRRDPHQDTLRRGNSNREPFAGRSYPERRQEVEQDSWKTQRVSQDNLA